MCKSRVKHFKQEEHSLPKTPVPEPWAPSKPLEVRGIPFIDSAELGSAAAASATRTQGPQPLARGFFPFLGP